MALIKPKHTPGGYGGEPHKLLQHLPTLSGSVQYELASFVGSLGEQHSYNAKLVCNLTSDEDLLAWRREFELLSGCDYVCYRSRAVTKVDAHRRFICHCSSYQKVEPGQAKSRKGSKYTDCKSMVTLTVRKDTPGTRHRHAHVKRGMRCEVTIDFHHTHLIQPRHRRIADSVRHALASKLARQKPTVVKVELERELKAKMQEQGISAELQAAILADPKYNPSLQQLSYLRKIAVKSRSPETSKDREDAVKSTNNDDTLLPDSVVFPAPKLMTDLEEEHGELLEEEESGGHDGFTTLESLMQVSMERGSKSGVASTLVHSPEQNEVSISTEPLDSHHEPTASTSGNEVQSSLLRRLFPTGAAGTSTVRLQLLQSWPAQVGNTTLGTALPEPQPDSAMTDGRAAQQQEPPENMECEPSVVLASGWTGGSSGIKEEAPDQTQLPSGASSGMCDLPQGQEIEDQQSLRSVRPLDAMYDPGIKLCGDDTICSSNVEIKMERHPEPGGSSAIWVNNQSEVDEDADLTHSVQNSTNTREQIHTHSQQSSSNSSNDQSSSDVACQSSNTGTHSGRLQCNFCDRTSLNEASLNAHFYAKHRHTRFLTVKPGEKVVLMSCEACGIRFVSYASLDAHIRFNHPGEKLVKCTVCAERFSSSRIMNCHLSTKCLRQTSMAINHAQRPKARQHAGGKPAPEPRLHETDTNETEVEDQVTSATASSIQPQTNAKECRQYGSVFAFARKATRIIQGARCRKSIQCNLCKTETVVRSFRAFDRHSRSCHPNMMMFKCSACAKRTNTYAAINHHINDHRSKKTSIIINPTVMLTKNVTVYK